MPCKASKSPKRVSCRSMTATETLYPPFHHYCLWPPGEMASRLTTNQEIAGSTPAVVIVFLNFISRYSSPRLRGGLNATEPVPRAFSSLASLLPLEDYGISFFLDSIVLGSLQIFVAVPYPPSHSLWCVTRHTAKGLTLHVHHRSSIYHFIYLSLITMMGKHFISTIVLL